MITTRILLALLFGSSSLAADCKNYRVDRAKLAQLGEAVENRVATEKAPGEVCHNGDSVACDALKKKFKTHEFHSQHPISVAWNQYTNDTCLPDPAAPCSNDGYPLHVVNASTAEHVQRVVEFARENAVALNIKNTGHDYHGRSNAPYAISLWTHSINSLVRNPTSFQPKGCDEAFTGSSITAGAGVQMGRIYEFLEPLGETVIGGTSTSVGLAGYVMGGGHSIISDNVLEFEVVLPNGELVHANECQNDDLFWALRGGGGSTYGIVTSITTKTVPTPKITASTFTFFINPDDPQALNVTSFFVSKLPNMVEQAANGYLTSLHKSPHPLKPNPAGPFFTGILGSMVLVDSEDQEKLENMLQDVEEEAKGKFPAVELKILQTTVYDSLLQYLTAFSRFLPNNAGSNMHIDSKLVSADMLRNEEVVHEVNKRAVSRGPFSTMGMLVVGGKGLRDAQPVGGSNAVHPSWKKTVASVFVTENFAPMNAEARHNAISSLQKTLEPFVNLDPSMGSYSNERDEGFMSCVNQVLKALAGSNWKMDFWGDNYDKLVEIKRKYDPEDLLWCHPCVGNERWERQRDGLVCKVTEEV
ncbi:putative FAD-linked oxidoreductase [Beauveria bassiana]|uniref:Putative FAD-linked oxidoreductase n=1 Tax=Beauveria bassiana TaxID=176275 RepID=A0A2N6N8N9_BEABA|nr:putative FAD-linked oxidoreductase [Beauveria bassiana]